MSEWSPTRVGAIADSYAGGTPDRSRQEYFGGTIPWVKSSEVNLGRIRGTEEFLTEKGFRASSAKLIPAGTVLVAMYGATAAQVAYLEIEATANQAVLAVRPVASVDSLFLYYALSSAKQRILFQAQGSGQPNLNKQIVDQVEILVPGIERQRRIADILSTLDETIEQTEMLIAKHQQMKAGLMQDLFTRGVTPDGRLRPTRAQAPHLYENSVLGWIPRAWSMVHLGALAEIVSGVTLGVRSEPRAGIEVPYLRVANVQDGYLDLGDVKTIKVEQAQFAKLRLRRGDVLMNEGGDFDKLGRGSVWRDEIDPCIHQNHVFRVRPRDGRLQSEFLAYWSQSDFGKKYFVRSSKQSTNLASINSSQLNRFPVALPSKQEQTAIEVRVTALNDRIAAFQVEANKLGLIKLGLMHDLLTGRVRVKVAESEEIPA